MYSCVYDFLPLKKNHQYNKRRIAKNHIMLGKDARFITIHECREFFWKELIVNKENGNSEMTLNEINEEVKRPV